MERCLNGHQVDKDTAKFRPECGQPKPPDELLQMLAEKVLSLEREVTELRRQLQDVLSGLQSAEPPQKPSWLKKAWQWFITH
jgi:hypothetical protein